MIKELLKTEKSATINFYNPVETFVDRKITKDFSVLTLSVQGLFWTGATAERYVSEQLRPDVSGVAVFDYEDYTVEVKLTARAIINGKTYSVIFVEDSGNQNEMILIALKDEK